MPEEDRLTLACGPVHDLLHEFGEAVRTGLGQRPKRLPCQYLYDERGSRLFEEICSQPEYYPTRTEAGILAGMASEVVDLFGCEPVLLELGSGSAHKTRFLLEAILERHGRARFEAIDVSRSALEKSARDLLADYPGLVVHGVQADYLGGMAAIAAGRAAQSRPRLVAWLGSSVGNFQRDQVAPFLAQIRAHMRSADRLLIGFDLRKSTQVLEAAYDDSAGVTAAFMRNILTRINRELGADFRVAEFVYRARYEPQLGRVEMSLESPDQHVVTISGLDCRVDFKKGEGIQVEYSYKYSDAEIALLARTGGFELQQRWTDEAGLFCEALLAPLE